MPLGLLGKKLGHTRVYNAQGMIVPVTVVLAGPNRVLQVKTQAGKDGYNAVQLGFDDQKEQRLTKPLLGHIKKHNAVAVKQIKEFRKRVGGICHIIMMTRQGLVTHAEAEASFKRAAKYVLPQLHDLPPIDPEETEWEAQRAAAAAQ